MPIMNRVESILEPFHELRTEFKKRVDCMFLPNKEDINTPKVGVVHEYKKCDDES